MPIEIMEAAKAAALTDDQLESAYAQSVLEHGRLASRAGELDLQRIILAAQMKAKGSRLSVDSILIVAGLYGVSIDLKAAVVSFIGFCLLIWDLYTIVGQMGDYAQHTYEVRLFSEDVQRNDRIFESSWRNMKRAISQRRVDRFHSVAQRVIA